MATLLALPPAVAAQGRKPAAPLPPADEQLSLNQQLAVEQLESLARALKSEADKPAAAALQARIADALWQFAEPPAREIFAWAFDAARAPLPDNLADAKRADYLRRQAAALKETLRLLGRHDSKQAEAWLKKFEQERATEESAARSRPAERAEFLTQLALELVPSDPAQAERLGLLALSGPEIPESFGRLLFALGSFNRSHSDALFRGALAALRRNGSIYDGVFIVLINYLFTASGELHSDAARTDAQLLIKHFLDAAEASAARWRRERDTGAPVVSDEGAKLYGLLAVRLQPIVARYAAERLTHLQTQMKELAAGLSQDQTRQVEALRTSRLQQAAVSDRNGDDIDDLIERAEKERDPQVRDALLGSAAHQLMREDADRALTVAARIDDMDLRAQTEDGINLARLQGVFNSRSYDEGRKVALRFNNTGMRARMLAELAGLVFSKGKDVGLAEELLTEAHAIALKNEGRADKPAALLYIARQFLRFDAARAFEVLADAVKAVNNLKSEAEQPTPAFRKARLLKFKSYTVINGSEIDASERATIDSLDFIQVAPLAAHNYMETRLLGERIEHPLLRAKFLIATASGVLSSPQQKLP